MIMFDQSLVGNTVRVSYRHQPVWSSRYIQNQDANPVFDGIRLYVSDDITEINHDETGWIQGETNYAHLTNLWDSGTTNEGFKHPHTYEIHWQEEYDSSLVVTSQTAPFVIYDVTYPDSITVAPYYLVGSTAGVFNIDKTKIGILSEPVLDVSKKTWEIRFLTPYSGTPQPPEPGDIFRLRIKRPFSKDDTFSLITTAASYQSHLTTDPLDSIMVVPNPYRAQSVFEPKSGFAAGRGDRQVQFINLPPVCTIKIYTIAGELVNTIEHSESFWNGREAYNLLNKERMEIAYGIYIWYVDASDSGLGDKIGKFAVIK
jgi:hypothetical protein